MAWVSQPSLPHSGMTWARSALATHAFVWSP
jgi:hypothetical protein